MKAKSNNKINKTMTEFGKGELYAGSKKGPVVDNKKQAIAIALNQARKKTAKMPVKKISK